MTATQLTETTESKQPPWAMAGLIASLVAAGLHGYLALQGFKLKVGVAEKSICNVNSTFNCDTILLSPFAEFIGIPLAVWGLVTNIVLSILIFVYMLNLSNKTERVERAIFWIASLVLAASLVMGVISTVLLKTYCLFCMATYALSVIQFLCAYFLQSTSPIKNLAADLTKTFQEQIWIIVLIVAIPVGSLLANSIIGDLYGFGMASRTVQEALFDWSKNEAQNFTADGLRMKNGTGQTKMLIVEFADFMCSHCKHAAPTIHNFVESRPEVEFIFKPFPLDGTCNNTGSGKGDGHRCKLAGAVICAESLANKGWIAHDYFYERQQQLSLASFSKNLAEISTMIGIGADSMQACVESQETMDKLIKSADEGNKAKIAGTPTFFVNGKLLPRAQFFPVLDAVYKELTK